MRAAAFGILSLLLLTPPALDAAPSRHATTIPHVLRFATATDISSLNPHLANDAALGYLSSLTMAWLTKTGPHNEIVPELLTVVPTQGNGGISRDGKAITWHLRHGVRWSDGAPFDADDVVFSIAAIRNPATNEIGRDGWDLISRVDEPDKYTVTIHLTRRYAPQAETFFSSSAANPCILPKHLLGTLATINDAAYNALPVGVGPFRYAAWKRGDRVELEANPYYFRGRPKLDKIEFSIVPDVNTVLTRMQTHELDLWVPITSAFYDRVRAIPGIRVLRAPSYTFDHIDFNLDRPVVKERAVRRALELALDRARLHQAIFHGAATVSESVFGPNHPVYEPIPMVPHDPALANRLLDQAGWKLGAAGIRSKHGLDLEITLVAGTGSPQIDALIEVLRADWREVGVQLDAKRVLPSLLFAPPEAGGIVRGGRFDAVLFAWGLDSLGELGPLYACGTFTPAGQNDMHWCNRSADAAMHDFTLDYDAHRRREDDRIVGLALARDVPTIVLDIRDLIAAYTSDLLHWQPNVVAPFDDMMNVDI